INMRPRCPVSFPGTPGANLRVCSKSDDITKKSWATTFAHGKKSLLTPPTTFAYNEKSVRLTSTKVDADDKSLFFAINTQVVVRERGSGPVPNRFSASHPIDGTFL